MLLERVITAIAPRHPTNRDRRWQVSQARREDSPAFTCRFRLEFPLRAHGSGTVDTTVELAVITDYVGEPELIEELSEDDWLPLSTRRFWPLVLGRLVELLNQIDGGPSTRELCEPMLENAAAQVRLELLHDEAGQPACSARSQNVLLLDQLVQQRLLGTSALVATSTGSA